MRNNLITPLAIFCFTLLSLTAYCNPDQANSTTNYQDTLKITQKQHFILPFHLIDGFILIDVMINEQRGKLMFDTGTPFSYFLNNNMLNLDKSNKIAEGQAGSGQEIILFKSDSLLSIKFNGGLNTFTEQGPIHADFAFVEKGITPEFLGFIGYGFFKNYEFIIDYDTQVIEFFLLNESGSRVDDTKKTDDNIVGVINFKNDETVNLPEIQLQIGTTSLPAYFDTGDQGDLTLTSETKNELINNNLLEKNDYPVWYGEYAENKNTFNLKSLKIQDLTLEKIKNLSISEGENKANLGYQFLKLYRTVWNFKTNTITLLKR